MTQPETAVGGEATPAPETNPADAFNDIAADMLGEDEQEEEQEEAAEGDGPEADEPDISDEDVEQEEALPAIDPPNSLNAEDKEAFKKLPREAQEFTARRIGEMERGFQTKAQEVAQQKQTIQAEALEYLERVKAETVERLQHYAQQLEVRPPDAALFRANPDAYAQQLEAYQYYTAQREQAQRDASKAQAERDQYATARQAHEQQLFRQRLEAELPEAFVTGDSGQKVADSKFIETLNATAQALDYDENAINQASVEELKALKVAADWKAKADKWDKAMAKKMDRVRSGKNPPPIARPGVARGPEQGRQARADQAWQSALTAKSRSAKDDALATWMENTGLLG